MTQMAGFDGGFQQPLALQADVQNLNSELASIAPANGGTLAAALTPYFLPVRIPGVPTLLIQDLGIRVSAGFAASTVGIALYSGVVPSSDNITLTLVGQLNAAIATGSTGSPHAPVTTGAAGSGAAPVLLDFTQNRYWVGAMVSDISTLAVFSFNYTSAYTDYGIMRYTAAARASTTDWPSPITQASLAVPNTNRYVCVSAYTPTGVNLL